jgi:hypothetical protein
MPDAARTTPMREVGTVFVPVTDQERVLDFYARNRFPIVQPG